MILEVLGSVQDGGAPHLGCTCDVCEKTREDPSLPGLISSLLLKENDDEDSAKYLIEATPDIRLQITGEFLDGVFLPHAKLGPIGGFEFFGEEGLDANMLTTYCNSDVEHYLMNNDPYRRMVDRGNIEIQGFDDGDSVRLQGTQIKALTYEHPHLGHKATAYKIIGENKTVFYLPDTNEWTERQLKEIEEADIAIIDGTFWNEDEIDRYNEVPHPTIEESMVRFKNYDTEIYFTHLNHTNPALREDSDERKELEENGFGVAVMDMEFDL
ncbi:MBL fold metallo-hydrolase [Candidatus Nanohalococcus occultus]|uniref:Metal-dependent hydrolase of the beta-lactamase superfamily n=1 Tax=Candidatus Nanohalococcus occultus TaxID=2978047 RepID=A0ABY8CDK5_9ARCH|nr:Metal-dependent hydrolase of the beta-lactamase superfamily [Candidatus Nanohaloarchaeota archaeon SVXNc]